MGGRKKEGGNRVPPGQYCRRWPGKLQARKPQRSPRCGVSVATPRRSERESLVESEENWRCNHQGPAPKLMLSARGILITSPTGFLANFSRLSGVCCACRAEPAKSKTPQKPGNLIMPTQSPLLSDAAAAESFEVSSSLDHFCSPLPGVI